MTGRAFFLVVLVVLLVGAAGATFVRCEGTAPTVAGPDAIALGRAGAAATVEVSDAGSGLREVRAVLVHAKGEATLLERAFPGELAWGGGEREPVTVEVALDARELGLKEGAATLRVIARDWSWRGGLDGNRAELEVPVTIDLTAPRVKVMSGLTYVRRGGSAAVVYELREETARDGVDVDGTFFPGYPLPGADDTGRRRRRLGLFGVPRDASEDPRVRVVVADWARNRRSASWATRVQERRFEDVSIKLSSSFLESKVAELARELEVEAEDPVAAFQTINTDVRAANEERIRGIVTGSKAEKLWQGGFLQLPNSRVTSRFAEQRSYLLDGEEVSRAIHYGYDLASLAHAPVVAANRGRVLFAGDLGIYGQTVILDHGGGLTSLYGHLSSLEVAPDDLVEKGEELGRSGETGLAGGDHLHFAIQVGGVYVDPLEWWDARWVRDHVEARLPRP